MKIVGLFSNKNIYFSFLLNYYRKVLDYKMSDQGDKKVILYYNEFSSPSR